MTRFFVILLMLLSYTGSAYAEDTELEKEVLLQVDNELKRVTRNLEGTLDKCNAIAANRTIDLSLFKDISFEGLRYSLLYLSRKAMDKCSLVAWKNYSYTLSKVKSVYEHYGKTPPDEVNLSSTIHFNTWQNMELEAKHKKIPAQYRVALDAMDALKTPFKATVLVDRIEKDYPPK